jgi:hypothetical protein
MASSSSSCSGQSAPSFVQAWQSLIAVPTVRFFDRRRDEIVR